MRVFPINNDNKGIYEPHIKVQDFKGRQSLGTKTFSNKTQRIQHLLSNLELAYQLHLEWTSDVVDFKEQFPLDLSETKDISIAMGFTHPHDKGIDIVMTTDFLVELNNDVKLARTVKPSSDLNNIRILEKFSIEREYWKRRKIDWGIVTEKDFNFSVFFNLINIVGTEKLINSINNDDVLTYILDKFKNEQLSLYDLTIEVDSCYSLDPGTAGSIILSLIANKLIRFDLYKEFSLDLSTSDFEVLV